MESQDVDILVVEDDGRIRAYLERVLPYRLTFAVCQEEAYDRLGSCDYDLVLLDLRIPRAPGDSVANSSVGIDVLRVIRDFNVLRKETRVPVPVVAMTAYGSESVAAELFSDLGVQFYVTKPFGQEGQLEERVQRGLEGLGPVLPKRVSRKSIRVVLRPARRIVQIETLICDGVDFEFMERLYMARGEATGVKGSELAKELGISEDTLRKRVTRFRKKISDYFMDEYQVGLSQDDIIASGSWAGYKVNVGTVKMFSFRDISLTPDVEY